MTTASRYSAEKLHALCDDPLSGFVLPDKAIHVAQSTGILWYLRRRPNDPELDWVQLIVGCPECHWWASVVLTVMMLEEHGASCWATRGTVPLLVHDVDDCARTALCAHWTAFKAQQANEQWQREAERWDS